MTDSELFSMIRPYKNYKTVGLDVQYCIIRVPNEKRIYLLFEETTSKIDWKTNLNFPCKIYKNQEGKFLVHRGYAKAWKSCNDEIMEEFITACNLAEDFSPFIIGWSYGGAMTLLAAEDFYYRTKRRANVITFGAPKILYFNKTKKHFKNSIGRIKQYAQVNDFVTWCVPFPFVHHINKVKCGDKFSLKKIFKTEYNHTHYDEVL